MTQLLKTTTLFKYIVNYFTHLLVIQYNYGYYKILCNNYECIDNTFLGDIKLQVTVGTD